MLRMCDCVAIPVDAFYSPFLYWILIVKENKSVVLGQAELQLYVKSCHGLIFTDFVNNDQFPLISLIDLSLAHIADLAGTGQKRDEAGISTWSDYPHVSLRLLCYVSSCSGSSHIW